MQKFAVCLQTPRLRIGTFDFSMAQSVSALSKDAANRRFMPDEVFETEQEAREVLETLIPLYDTGEGPLVYPVFLHDLPIGHVELVPIGQGDIEIGYHIGEGYTGRGYATEAVRALLPRAGTLLNKDMIFGICEKENLASRKILEKCGFDKVFEGVASYQGTQKEICRYVKALLPVAEK